MSRYSTFRMRIAAGFFLTLLHASVAPASVFYDFDIIAVTGQAGLTSIDSNVSINDSGKVAFVGRLAGGEGVFVGDGSADPQNITPSRVTSRISFAPAVQINNMNQVVARQLVSGSGTTPPRTFLRRWDANAIESFTDIAIGGGTSDPFSAIFSFPSINNNDQVVFSAQLGGSFLATPSGSIINPYNLLSMQLPLRPVIADDGRIAVRPGNSSTSPIQLWSNDLLQLKVIASGSMGFTQMGRSPGISDDGTIVVFAGNRGSGDGVFASLEQGGTRTLVRIAGENAGASGPRAELGSDDLDNPLFLNSIDIDSRVSVVHLPAGVAGIEDDSFVVSFVATPNAPSATEFFLSGLKFSNQKGIWTVRFDVTRDQDPPHDLLFIPAHPPIPVVQVGDTIPVVQIDDTIKTFQIDNLALYDPLAGAQTDALGNPRSQQPGDHRVAFWASSGSTQLILRAEHLDACLLPIRRLAQAGAKWADKSYDHSYRTTTSYSTKNTTSVSATGKMELSAGIQGSFPIQLSPAENNLTGLAAAIKRYSGFNAELRADPQETGPPRWYLDVYNFACQNMSCYPRESHKLELCDDSCLPTPINLLAPKKIRQVGCALTSLTMALKHVGVTSINMEGSTPLDPFVLNEFMSNTVNLSALGGAFDDEGDVDFDDTARKIGQNISNNKFRFDQRSLSSVTKLSGANNALDKALCVDKLPMLVGVKLNPDGVPGHYVLVTGKRGSNTDGNQYLIADPGHRDRTTLKNYSNKFLTVGVTKDPPNMSGLNIRIGDNGDLLIVDESGRKTGFDVTTNMIVEEIPDSSYARLTLVDDETDEPATEVRHIVQIREPKDNKYTIIVNGAQMGAYALSVKAYSTDGTIQPEARVEGVTVPGGSETFSLQYSTAPDAEPIIVSGNSPPVANAGSDQTVPCSGPTGTQVTLNGTGSSDPDGDALTHIWSGPFGTASGSTPIVTLPLGTHTITLTVNDSKGGTATDQVVVTVKDTTAPVPDLASLPNVTGECSAQITSPPTATDNCAGVITGTTSDPLSYSQQGTFTVTWTFSDGKGNTSSQTQTVIVVDQTPPAITCPSNQTAECTGPNGAAVSFSPTATDNCTASPMLGCNPPSGSLFALGTTTDTCTATDAAINQTTCSFAVTVVDTTPPSLSALWVPLKVEEDEGTFRLEFSVTDVCHATPQVTGAVRTPALGGLKIELKTKAEVKVEFDRKEKKVKIQGPNPQALLTQLQQFGGLVVTRGQVVKVELKEANSGKQEFKFEKDGTLKIEAPTPTMRVTGKDNAGNTATVQVSPQFASGDDDEEDD